MVVLLDPHRIAYFPIPKVANTSIKLALEGACAQVSGTFKNTGNNRMSAALRARADGYWKVAVVRDPMKRMLSAYGNRVIDEGDITRSRLSRGLLRALGRSPTPDIDEFFTHLGAYMATNDRIRRHLLLQERYLGPDLGWFDAIYRIEDLGQFSADMAARIGAPVTIGRHQTGRPKFTQSDLAPATAQKLSAYIAPDYKLLTNYYHP